MTSNTARKVDSTIGEEPFIEASVSFHPTPRVPARGTPTMDTGTAELMRSSMVGVPLAGTLGWRGGAWLLSTMDTGTAELMRSSMVGVPLAGTLGWRGGAWLLSSLLALLLILAGCGGGSASNTPDARTLIKQAQVAIQKVTSYHFNLTVDNPGTGGTLIIKTADGDIVVPDKLKANANVLILGNVVQVQLITIGSNQYVTDPITNQWQRTKGLLDPRTLSDSKTGVAAILGNIQNPTTPVDANVDGTPCWSIDGTLDAKYLAAITGGGAPTGSIVKVTTCIGKSDNLPYLIKMSGVAAAGDTSQTVRTFKLSKFNESLTITAPI